MNKLYESTWSNDSKPHSPSKSCGLSVINPQWFPKVALLAVALANVATLASRGFFYIDTNNQISYGGCFSRGDLFSLCITGVAVSLVSIMLASFLVLKDFIMCAVNSLSWIRWMQIVEGTAFLLLSVWWAVSSALYYITVEDAISAGTPIMGGNSSVSAPDLSQDAVAASGMNLSVGLHFALLGNTVGCLLSNVFWLFFYYLCSRCSQGGDKERL